METEKKLISKIQFGIDYFIQEQISNRNWSNEELLDKLEISKMDFDKIVENKKPITVAFATTLSILFATSAEYWINIDLNYKNWLKNSTNK